MKAKKTKKADLNNFSTTFFLLGLVVTLAVANRLINWKFYEKEIEIGKVNLKNSEEEKTLTIKIDEPEPQPKPKPRELDKIEIEKDDKKIADVIFKSTDPDDKPIEIDDLPETADPDEVEVKVVHANFVEQVPIFPGCEGKKGKELRKCLNDKINKWVGKKFDTSLAQDLGLYGERVRIFTEFTIDENGKIINIKARSKYKVLDKEATRVLASLPKMKPGMQNYRKVRVTYNLPIVFDVGED